ncbi:FKBP-type peptidyl-prolyl cis-trans isomerase N-terminal domain-containing protein [Klebsiella michiganensis]|uniref:FKBP-type peptidyl-prolyl cis-trans isomerase N-terminal domain-containing protein n=1 Tax=Klebsiella michiganensis TaxID=1134687 RepID=UPI0018D33CCC|nr:FKBP-type peptidyl-prolyl cis-trans isomerase N-terminal domain-containing protein [Klebsiella michiganensis]MDS7798731.1 FKBP-type peptidyl-prolyl cis-trans isomerase N-terminal domain-containing protein [Klebsiella michiganensis]QPQ10310.1 FKBP-type peptidyl-prolyl cis-trans isomerase [Klebsiella michiganensis]UPI86505.1 FKBP-type peptidyl-prolyl cis-trans isomerase [Klebsiella michiganensis]WLP17834.1 FKBP-type peptidyl-prolyl cis-trans isomerase N-terminal domain-containing protein [Kleb
MNGKIAKNFNPVSLAAVFVLALSPDAYAEKDALISVTASSNSDASGPAFLNYAKEHQAQKISEPVKPVEEKSNNTKTTNKKTVLNTHEVSRQAAVIAQKDKLIRQLQQQLDAKPATMNAEAGNQKELKNKIQLLEKKLATAVAEKQQLIDNALSDAAEIKQIEGQRNATENKTLQQEKRVALLESAKQKVERQLAEATAEKQSLQQKLAALETEKQDKLAAAAAEKLALTGKFTTEAKERQALATRLAAAEAAQQEMLTKLTAADAAQRALQTKLDASQTEQKAAIAKLAASEAEKTDLTTKLAAAGVEKQALTAKLDAVIISTPQPSLQADAGRQQAGQDNALQQASTDEITRLKSRLADAEARKPLAIDFAKEPLRQAYAIGVSMGEEVLQLLSTRASQGVKTSKDTVLQGIMDSFSGDIALDEKARNKALFDVSKKVFQNLKKLEQQTLSEGKKYQQNFAKQKGVVLKDGIYSRIDYAGKGKILDSDIVTVTIKETLTDGTVINDMEAEGKVWSQPLKSYPPLFLGPLKRLGNHGAITVVIPPNLAYGSEGKPPKIPPGATMVYTVRIVDATAAEPQAKKP